MTARQYFARKRSAPLEVRRRLRETVPGPNAATIIITNREAFEAIRSRTIDVPRGSASSQPTAKSQPRKLVLHRWQLVAGGILLAVATLTALLVWAIHSG